MIDMGKDFKLKKVETRGKGKNWSTDRRLFAVVNKRGLMFRFELNPILTKYQVNRTIIVANKRHLISNYKVQYSPSYNCAIVKIKYFNILR